VSVAYPELKGLWVSLDRVEFNDQVQVTPDRPYGFVYYITIHNDSTETVTIKGRKWVVANANGSLSVTEGDGVVGEFPCLDPGGKFHYNSYHLVDSDSFAQGAYLVLTGSGSRVIARIPSFKMRIPHANSGSKAAKKS